MIRRIKNSLISLNHFRKFIGRDLARQAIKSDFRLIKTNEVEHGKVLVIAPHPDDDIIGCGGALVKHLKAKDQVKIVYLCDGSLGSPEGKRLSQSEKAQLVKIREVEARESAEIIGVSDLIFWRYKDGHLVLNNTSKKLMNALLESFDPDIVYVPSFDDPNSDHAETVKILAAALSGVKVNPQIVNYEVWQPVFANRIVDVTAEFAKKKQALEIHRSQLKSRNYSIAIEGLAMYRAGTYGAGGFAEAFFVCNKNLYLKVLDYSFSLLKTKVQ